MPDSDDLPPSLTALATRNCIQLGDGVRWRSDVERLSEALERMPLTTSAEPMPEPPVPPGGKSRLVTAGPLRRAVYGARDARCSRSPPLLSLRQPCSQSF